MHIENMEHLKFPIGKFKKPDAYTEIYFKEQISIIENFPRSIKKALLGLTDEQLDTPYRPEGWTIRQVVHHCADSHMNSLTRFKLTLTEDKPVIKPYYEERWAELSDSKTMPLEPSLNMLEGIHERWTVLLNNLTSPDFERSFIHPEHGKEIPLKENIGIYAWHCQHHLAHITTLKEKMGWK
jgi:hypothetical protein